MFSTLKFTFKEIFFKIGFGNFATILWFKYLAFKNGLSFEIKQKENKINIAKNDCLLIIKGNNKSFGGSGIVLRDFENVFKTVKPKTINNINVVDFSISQIHTLSGSNKQFLFHDICEPISVTDLYLHYGDIKEGDVVFDIGTYAGTQTVFFSEKVGAQGKVYAFEPDDNSYESLKFNLELNKVKNVTALKIGLYDFDGKMYFSQGGSMGSQIVEISDDKLPKTEFPSIEVAKIETIIKNFSIEKVDFIKMDIEGAEMQVLKSSIGFIKKFKPRFIIEPHFIKGVLNLEEIIDFFTNLNYTIIKVKQGDFDYQPLVYAYPTKYN